MADVVDQVDLLLASNAKFGVRNHDHRPQDHWPQDYWPLTTDYWPMRN